MKYCFDTSSFIHASLRAYPPLNFPSFWKNLDSLIQSGNVTCPKAVLTELEKKDDDLLKWAKAHSKALIVEHDQPIQTVVSAIMADSVLQKLVDINRDRSAGDPFVVATAKTRGLILVTQEDYGKKTAVKIPNVCDAIGVKHIKLVDLIIAEKWVM